jgi:hypothetical protein
MTCGAPPGESKPHPVRNLVLIALAFLVADSKAADSYGSPFLY